MSRPWASIVAAALLAGCASDPQTERAQQAEMNRKRAEGVALALAWSDGWTWTAPPAAATSTYFVQAPAPVRYHVAYVPPATTTSIGYGTYAPNWTPVAGNAVGYSAYVPPTTWTPPVYEPPVYSPPTWTPAPDYRRPRDRAETLRDLEERLDAASRRIGNLRARTVRSSRYDDRIHFLEMVRDAARKDFLALRDGRPGAPTDGEVEERLRTLEAYVDTEGRAIEQGR